MPTRLPSSRSVRALCVCLAGLLAATGCATGSGASSANSSAGSDNSSGASADSSANSADSSNASNASSENSRASSQSNSDNSSAESTGNSSAGSAEQSAQVSAVVAGSALLLSTVAGIGFSIYGTVRALEPGTSQAHAESTALYLGAQTHQLKQDLALGAGPVVDDLASAAGISRIHREHFGRLLQRHRRELLALADRDALTPARALQFLHRIGELTWSDPVLHASAERALAMPGSAG